MALCVAGLVIGACSDHEDHVATTTTSSTTTTTTTLPATTTTAAPTPMEIVNGIRYSAGDQAAAMQAYRVVAEARGWSPVQVAEWEVFVADIIRRESNYCWNMRGGARIAEAEGCVVSTKYPGHASDSGFGQVIWLHYNPETGFLCAQEGLCSQDDIVATPWSSMTALLALLERNGRQPWCFRPGNLDRFPCATAPEHPPAIAA